jgi:hypothetical protein
MSSRLAWPPPCASAMTRYVVCSWHARSRVVPRPPPAPWVPLRPPPSPSLPPRSPPLGP